MDATENRALQPSTASTSVASPRAKSTPDLIRAIQTRGDRAYTLDRTRRCLALYYDAASDDVARAEIIERFAVALGNLPPWAVARGFDAWERTGKRRPTPADIVSLSEAALKEFTDELARRRAAAPPPEPERHPVDKDAAAEILARAGFTPARMEAIRRAPMASSWGEAEAPVPEPRRNREDDPDYMACVRAAREGNNLIQTSRAWAADREGS
ncbi:hypothetical protein EYE35_01210 [Cereibacter sphaeroides]|nr:hypothetical protein EYE35_01210 [Cereibacter sphaeroides]